MKKSNALLKKIVSMILVATLLLVFAVAFTSCKSNINVDTDGDGKPDINLDTDSDGKSDVNIDSDGDQQPDVNVDTDGDGVPDTNIDFSQYPDGIETPIIPLD